MALTLGVDLGGTKLSAAIVSNGEISKRIERPFNREQVIDDLVRAIIELDIDGKCQSVGEIGRASCRERV